MADKLMNITQKKHFCRLQLVVETFEHSTKLANQSKSIKVPKVVNPTSKKTLLKTLGTSVIQTTIVPSLLAKFFYTRKRKG